MSSLSISKILAVFALFALYLCASAAPIEEESIHDSALSKLSSSLRTLNTLSQDSNEMEASIAHAPSVFDEDLEIITDRQNAQDRRQRERQARQARRDRRATRRQNQAERDRQARLNRRDRAVPAAATARDALKATLEAPKERFKPRIDDAPWWI